MNSANHAVRYSRIIRKKLCFGRAFFFANFQKVRPNGPIITCWGVRGENEKTVMSRITSPNFVNMTRFCSNVQNGIDGTRINPAACGSGLERMAFCRKNTSVINLEFQLEHDLILYTRGVECLRLTYWPGCLPHLWWILWHILMTVLTVLLTGNRLKWEKKHINPNTIQIAMDSMPFGICCYTDNGHVVFSNSVMDELCMGITGRALMNGFELSNAFICIDINELPIISEFDVIGVVIDLRFITGELLVAVGRNTGIRSNSALMLPS